MQLSIHTSIHVWGLETNMNVGEQGRVLGIGLDMNCMF